LCTLFIFRLWRAVQVLTCQQLVTSTHSVPVQGSLQALCHLRKLQIVPVKSIFGEQADTSVGHKWTSLSLSAHMKALPVYHNLKFCIYLYLPCCVLGSSFFCWKLKFETESMRSTHIQLALLFHGNEANLGSRTHSTIFQWGWGIHGTDFTNDKAVLLDAY
jgi:hypothetical protein